MKTLRCLSIVLSFSLFYFLAVFTGERAFYLCAILFAAVFFYALISVFLAFFTLSVETRQTSGHMQKGTPFVFKARLKVFSPLPIGQVGLRIKIPYMHAGDIAIEEVFLRPFTPLVIKREFACEYRGIYEVGATDCLIKDFFGLFCLKKKIQDPLATVFVAPRYIVLPPMHGSGMEEGYMPTRALEDTTSYADVSPYEKGDSLRRIHWKLSLKKRELLVRRFEAQSFPDLLLLMDVTPPEGIATLRMQVEDLMCDCASSFAHAQLCANFPVYMPLFAKNNLQVNGQSGRDFPAFLEALTELTFNGQNGMEEILQGQTRLFKGGLCVLILSHLNSALADHITRLKSAVQISVICVFKDEHDNEALVTQIQSAGIPIDILTPAIGVEGLLVGGAL